MDRIIKASIQPNFWGLFLLNSKILQKKSFKYAALFFKVGHYPPLSAFPTMYKTLYEPHLNDCNVIWCNTLPTHLKKLEILPRVIPAITWSKFTSHTRKKFKH